MDKAIAYNATIKSSQLSDQNQKNRNILLQDVTPAVPQFEGQYNRIIDINQGEDL